MKPQQRPKREVNKKYMEYIREQPCVVTSRPNVDAHHLISVGAGGSDYTCVPLVRVMHQEYHAIGQKEFEERYGVNLWKEAFMLLKEWVESGA